MTAKRVLIVDDDWEWQLLVRLYLTHTWPEWTVETASSGEHALVKLNTRTVDLLITDLHMKEMSGLALVKHVRKHFPETRIILMTADREMEKRVNVARIEVEGKLTKPFSLREFLVVVQKALEQSILGLLALSSLIYMAWL